MGGAGVAQIDDENAGHWNPANLSLTSASASEGDYATSFGLQLGGEVQTTRDFLKESDDLVEFADTFSLTDIQSSNYSDPDTFTQFLKMFKELDDVNQEGQGVLGNFKGGLNIRHTNWSVSANNFTDFAAFTELNTENVVTGGLGSDSGTVRQFVSGDSTNLNISGTKPSSQDFRDAANTIKNQLDQELEDQNVNLQDDLGFDNSVTSDSVANEIASRVEQSDPVKDGEVSASDLEQASQVVLPNIISLVSSDGTATGAALAATGTGSDVSFDTQSQRLVFQGASVNEATFHYAKPEPLGSFGGSPLYVGANLRFMQGRVAYVEENPFESSASDTTDDIFNQDEDVETSTDFGVDLGLTYDAREEHGFKMALVGKYLNTPSFDYPDNEHTRDTVVKTPDKFEIEPQLRLGISGYPLDYMPVNMGRDWWQLSLDYDLTKNETIMKDYEKQYLAIGNEFNLLNSFWLNLALRAGVRENMVESTEGRIYTGGVGLQLAGLNVEVSGKVSDERVEDEDGDELPTVAGGSFNLSYRF